MGILVVGGALFGMILGQFFKWFILLPACGLAVANPAHMESGFLGWFVQTVLLSTSLQIGYVVGLVARNFHSAPTRSKNLGVRCLGETSPIGSESRERGKRAA
jgi:hypothetical protein